MPKFYKLIPHTADLRIYVSGKNLKSLYQNSSLALSDLIAGVGNISKDIDRRISVKGIDKDDLLIRWLNELIYLFSAKKMVFSDFDIIELTDRRLTCLCKGERFNLNKHAVEHDIKAATYSGVSIKDEDGVYQVKIVFDI
ncbi:MAG: archease [Candidatus Omnitrophica bacterium]|nr:archease [Candidatus Omnitrophota bacterium]